MADIYSAALATVQSVCGPIWRYSKNQYQYKADLEAFNDRKEELCLLRERIQSKLTTELQTGRKIARPDVVTWLTAAGQEIDKQSVEDEVSQSGCLLSCICRTRVLTRRTADLVQIYDRGESLSQRPSLVDDDYTTILLDDIQIYKDQKDKLLNKFDDVQLRLHTQLQDGGKIEKKEVKLWLRNVEEKTSPAATSFEIQFANGPYDGDFPRCVKERKQQLEALLHEGTLLPESLVLDDYSQTLGDDERQSFEEWKEKLHGKNREVKAKLSTELCQNPEKIVAEHVKQWLQKVEGIIIPAASDVHNQLSSGRPPYPASLVNRVKELIQEMEKLCNEGDQLPESLVVDDYSLTLSDDDRKTFVECTAKLKGKYQDVGGILQSQLRLGKIEMEQVKIWKKQVEETTVSAADVQNQLNNGPPHTASLVGRVTKIIQKMEKLHDEGCKLPESLVIDDPSASAPAMLTSELRGNDDVKTKILEHLTGDQTTKIGVWGMGGVGKTTIMKHVHNQLLKESKFKKVIWVTVSQAFDVRRIQQEIATGLEENLSEHQNTVGRAARLSKMLETLKPCVVILDDVWKSIDLEEVGIPQPRVNDSCKLLLTTRSKEVARGMGCVTIEVKTLSPEASLNLFNDIVGDVALSEDGDIKETLKLIVEECDGLPLAIKVVAGGMKGIFEPHLWRAALNRLRQGRRNDVYSKLKFSYDWLGDQIIQHCFLHCALYPEDHKIPKEELIEYWIDEELIAVMQTREEMKDEGHAILNKLEENCLLEFTWDWLARDFVRMHDLVRDMAIDITRTSSPRFLVKAGVGLEELPEEHEWEEDLLKVSLMSNNIEDIPSSMSLPRCPILTTLLLSNNDFSTIPENFFEHMPELKVLDLSYNEKLRSLPSSVSKLVKLTTLLLRYCKSLKEVPSLSNLTALKKLDLYRAGVEEVPHGLEMLLNLKYLDIRRSSDDRSHQEVPTGWKMLLPEILPNLSKLQYLGLDPKASMEGGQLGGIKLESFYGSFRGWSDMSISLNKRQKSLYHYNIFVGDDYNIFVGDLIYARCELKCIDCCDINICGEPGSIPSDVQRLMISRCNDVRSLNAISGFRDVFDLQECDIRGCRELEYVFSLLNHLSKLKRLTLWNLENLKGLFDSEAAPPLAVLSSLEEISILRCPKINKLLPTTLQYLPNLKNIHVYHCGQLEEIMVGSSSEEGRVIHAKLEKLDLEGLPMLRSISSLTDASVFDSLKQINIFGCPNLNMEYVFGGGHFEFNSLQSLETLMLEGLQSLKSIFHESLAFLGTETFSFPLYLIWVKGCSQLKKFFTHARQLDSFQNIESIEVDGCDELEEIMQTSSETEEEQSKLILPKLKTLSLIKLPVLRRICSALLVPGSLQQLKIEDCPNLSWECLFGLQVELPQQLLSLSLKGVRNLEFLFDDEASESLALFRFARDAITSFALQEICVEDCPHLKKIFSDAGLLGYFQNVRDIEVAGCVELEEILSSKSEEEPLKVTPLPNLKRLHLRNLPKLKRVCTATSALICDSLEYLAISGCTELKRVPLHLLRSDNGQLSPPPNLRIIELSDKEKEWWESLEWDQPNAKAVLSPFCKFK